MNVSPDLQLQLNTVAKELGVEIPPPVSSRSSLKLCAAGDDLMIPGLIPVFRQSLVWAFSAVNCRCCSPFCLWGQ